MALSEYETAFQHPVVVEKVSISILTKAADAFLVGGRGSTQLWDQQSEGGEEGEGGPAHLPHFTSPWQTQAVKDASYFAFWAFFAFLLRQW